MFVLDHLAKPPIKSGELEPWKSDILELAKNINVHCKLSGMVTEGNWGNWTKGNFRPYMDVIFDAFGTDRIMFGSTGQYACYLEIIPKSYPS